MKNLLFVLLLLACCGIASAQRVKVAWNTQSLETLSTATVEGEDAYASLITPSYLQGTYIDSVAIINSADGSAPMFASYYVDTRKTAKTANHCVAWAVKPETGHKFKPLKISFDACKVGTDGGNFDVYVKTTGYTEKAIATMVVPLRNKVVAGTNPNGYSHHEYVISDYIVDGRAFNVIIYMYNFNGTDSYNAEGQFTGKALAIRNMTIEGAVDEEIFSASHFVSAMTCSGKEAYGEPSTIDLYSIVKNLKNGERASYPKKLYGDPTDFALTLADGYTSSVSYSDHIAKIQIKKGGEEVFNYEVLFTVTDRQPKPEAKPLDRGLISLNLSGSGSTGNLISWRYRESDNAKVKFKLWRGSSKTSQLLKVNNGNYITNKTNFRDASGSTSSYYRLEVYDLDDNLLESEVSMKTWSNQTMTVKTSAPVDTRGLGASYTPNDASFCDMDGDGEYEIILKWDPSNSRDAAGNGVTSDTYFDCYKLDGTLLWRINQGPNICSGAHTTPFVAWDFDGDGYGEFMIKTAPGTVDGEGNYVVMPGDDPLQNCLSSRGKPDKGPEYITIFDGLTGAELSTIPYHTNYNAGLSYWGDSNQNRSERYLACIAYLDGEDKNPSAIFCRGYYAGAFVGAYDFDGVTLKERWVSRNTTKGQGLYGEGAHWMTGCDADGDGKHEILFGSACLDHDGKLLYRTGLGHGDALHVGDFLTDRPGLEVFMAHEEKPYGCDLRDAKTGELLLHWTASGDTGRGLAAHFDSSQSSAQFIYSASPSMFNCEGGSLNGETWAIGSSGAGINNRIYWSGDLYDEFFDKSIIAHWNPKSKWFDRYKVNNSNYVPGTLNNASKYNPCVLGDLLGDWREEIVTWDSSTKNLLIVATSYETTYMIPHLMEDIQYRENVVSQNCAYNQPPHLSYDPAIKYEGNPLGVETDKNIALAIGDVVADKAVSDDAIYTLQGVKLERISSPGIYIIGGKKVYVK